MTKTSVGIGLIGSGFMGRCHANAFRAVGGLFDLPFEPQAVILGDATPELARRAADAMGFPRATADWREVVHDPAVEIVSITAPNALHEPIALAAIAAGKTVYCEKPLSVTARSAELMMQAAEDANAVTMVGFNFLRNPMIRLAKEIIHAGDIGEVTGFRGRHAENYMASPEVPHSFRTAPAGGGAVADIGSHIVSLIRYLLGPMSAVSAISKTIHTTRPLHADSKDRAPVDVDDMTHALVRMDSGVVGSVEANWAATARTMDLSFEISGTRGSIAFSQERMNELLLQIPNASSIHTGYQRIEAGPTHAPYGQFCPAPGHHLGFNDLKVIEVAELIQAYAGQLPANPDFREAWEVQKVIEAMQASAQTTAWVEIN